MLLGKDERVEIYIGKGFSGDWDFKNEDGTPKDMSSITSTNITVRNIDPQFSSDPIITDIGTVVIEPESKVGRVNLKFTHTETQKLKIPSMEKEPYTESAIYSKIILSDQDDVPFLELNVAPIKV